MRLLRTLSLALPAVLLALSVGCSPNAAPKTKEQPARATQEGVVHPSNLKDTPAEQHPDRSQVSELRTPNPTIRAPKIASRDNAKTNLTDQAEQIAHTVTRIPGVERAAVLVTGKTALVGVDLAAQITGSKIDSIKYSVKEAAERSGQGYHAVVTSDIDTVTRARTLIKGIQQGKPVTSVSDEIADIVSRLVPEM